MRLKVSQNKTGGFKKHKLCFLKPPVNPVSYKLNI